MPDDVILCFVLVSLHGGLNGGFLPLLCDNGNRLNAM